jgi:signal peptidase I
MLYTNPNTLFCYRCLVECRATAKFSLHENDIRGKSYLQPDKDISAIIASTNDQMIGKDVFCVAGDTIVIHNEVSTRIDDIKITNESTTLGYDTNNKEFVDSSIDGIGRSYHSSSVSLEFEDGTSIEVTNNHQFLLTNGLYISASEVHDKLLNGEEVDVVSIV